MKGQELLKSQIEYHLVLGKVQVKHLFLPSARRSRPYESKPLFKLRQLDILYTKED